jgi:hypothetical protein
MLFIIRIINGNAALLIVESDNTHSFHSGLKVSEPQTDIQTHTDTHTHTHTNLSFEGSKTDYYFKEYMWIFDEDKKRHFVETGQKFCK